MLVRQIDRNEALGLAAKGMEIKVLVPASPEPTLWTDYAPDTLQNLLDGCLFFRDEIAQAVPPAGNVPVEKAGDACLENSPTVGNGIKRTKRVDTGKLLALYKAGWTQKKIAEELKVAPSTVCAYLKKIEEGQDHEKD